MLRPLPLSRRPLLLAAVLLAVPTGIARAQDYPPEAIETHRQGVEAFERGDIDEAIRLFRESYEVHHGHPYALFNLGECYERLGDLAQAVDWFERYIAATGDDAADREVVLERIRNLRTRPATVTLRSTPPGASVTVSDPDGTPRTEFPAVVTPADLDLPPGTFVLRFELPDRPEQTRVVEGGLGRRATLDVVFAATETPVPPPVEGPATGDGAGSVFLSAQGGVIAALSGADNVFATAGAGIAAGYEFSGDPWRFVLGGDFWFGYYPIEVRQTGARHATTFLDVAAVPGIAWQPLPALRLVGSVGIGLGVYLPPDDPAIPVPWVGAPLDGPTLLFHLRPAVALEWLLLDAFGLYAVPLAVDIDIPLGPDVLRRVLVNYLAVGGLAAHF
ncbi:MAG: tetratricopeptide repeat protein [Deltaproteobacteria bacterium]|nr:tetratricopeptide repeat protein [Deltaproteobacteria bacterium]